MDESVMYIIRFVQTPHFSDEIKSLKNKTAIDQKKKLLALNPVIDEQEILRGGGKIERLALAYNTKHPITLQLNTKITRSIMFDYYNLWYHAGLI